MNSSLNRTWASALRNQKIWFAAALALMALIYWASDRSWGPDGTGLRLPQGSANLVHFVLYAVLTGCWGLAFGAAKAADGGAWNTWWAALAIAGLFGLFDEWHQDFVPGRSCSLFDALENFLGGLFGLVFLKGRLSSRGLNRRYLSGLLAILILGVFVGLRAAALFPELDASLSSRHEDSPK